jgi:hypothetical protein
LKGRTRFAWIVFGLFILVGFMIFAFGGSIEKRSEAYTLSEQKRTLDNQ